MDIQLVENQPEHAESWHFLDLLYCQTGKFTMGIEALQQAVNLHPPNAVYLTNLGEALHRAGNLSVATTFLEQAIVSDSSFVQAHFNLVYKKNKIGDSSNGAISSRYSSAIQPWASMVQPGQYLYCKGNVFKSAVEAPEAALKFQPDFPQAQMNLGVAYSELGEMQKAINRYKNAIEQHPQSADAYRNLG